MTGNWAPTFTPWGVSNNPANDEASLWGNPVYFAKSTDPLYTINDTEYACSPPNADSTCPTSLRIPNGASHSLGGDGHIAVIQPDGHTEVDAWQVQNANPISDGGVLTVHAYGALDLDGPGCCGGATAALQGLLAGAIRGPELATGVINHALDVAEKCSNGGFVPPAMGTGAGGCAGAPPMGARLQLKMSDSQIAALNVPPYQKVILTAMAHYGIYITDTGGSPMDLYFDNALQYTGFGNTSNTVMSYLKSQGYSDPYTISIGLPWSNFQVVSSCYGAKSC
jgi:hypothetical protein